MSKNVEFITEFIELLGGDEFFLCDRIDQDDLFEMQDRISQLICNSANDDLGLAKFIIDLCPNTFKTEKI